MLLLPQTFWRKDQEMREALQLPVFKRTGRSLTAANDVTRTTRRLFVTCRKTKTQFLVDTGSDVSVFPRSAMLRRPPEISYTLYAANGSTIATYGWIIITPDLGLKRAFPWNFVVANVTHPIIGADLLAHYHLIPDLRQRKLSDGETGLQVPGSLSNGEVSSIKVLRTEDKYHRLLAEFSGITRPTTVNREIKHSTVHFINTTPGPPEACKP